MASKSSRRRFIRQSSAFSGIDLRRQSGRSSLALLVGRREHDPPVQRLERPAVGHERGRPGGRAARGASAGRCAGRSRWAWRRAARRSGACQTRLTSTRAVSGLSGRRSPGPAPAGRCRRGTACGPARPGTSRNCRGTAAPEVVRVAAEEDARLDRRRRRRPGPSPAAARRGRRPATVSTALRSSCSFALRRAGRAAGRGRRKSPTARSAGSRVRGRRPRRPPRAGSARSRSPTRRRASGPYPAEPRPRRARRRTRLATSAIDFGGSRERPGDSGLIGRAGSGRPRAGDGGLRPRTPSSGRRRGRARGRRPGRCRLAGAVQVRLPADEHRRVQVGAVGDQHELFGARLVAQGRGRRAGTRPPACARRRPARRASPATKSRSFALAGLQLLGELLVGLGLRRRLEQRRDGRLVEWRRRRRGA